MTGKNKVIWERQDGRCYICDRIIHRHQERQLIQIDLSKKPGINNLAYVHAECVYSKFLKIHTSEIVNEVNVLEMSQKIVNNELSPINQSVKEKLESFFSTINKKKLTITIKQIEDIIGESLPDIAYNLREYWLTLGPGHITSCWDKYGYCAVELEKNRKSVLFMKKDCINRNPVKLPEKLQRDDLPEPLIYELNEHFKYLIRKYGL